MTISVGSLIVATKNPLMRPSASPITPATRNATRIESPMPNAIIALVPTYIENAAMAVNDTSMPPDASTKSTPTANIAVTMRVAQEIEQGGQRQEARLEPSR